MRHTICRSLSSSASGSNPLPAICATELVSRSPLIFAETASCSYSGMILGRPNYLRLSKGDPHLKRPRECLSFLQSFASSALHPALSESEFHKVADRTMDHLHDTIEAFLEDQDQVDADVEYSMGVMTVKLGSLGTYVINKQTPNRQIWMSSPLSGPVRYDWRPREVGGAAGDWVYARDGHDLVARLEIELSKLVGLPLKL